MQMNVEFKSTTNGQQTCAVNGIHLHSSYNPDREAQKFVDSISVDFDPFAIIITEPCLSYQKKYLDLKFPDAKKLAIRFSHAFKEYDQLWDKVFYTDDGNLSENLYFYLGDEGINRTIFISWQPSQKVFGKEYDYCWDHIKKSVLKSHQVLQTRQFFAKRWFSNTLNFFTNVNSTGYIQKGTSPILICASGKSLDNELQLIKKHRNKFFLIAVSSAVNVLCKNDIIPDLAVSTDGGFYAKLHLIRNIFSYKIPLAVPPEAGIFSSDLENSLIIPISYGDGPQEDFIKESKYPFVCAQRNGTVSGTAATLAMNITSGNIYFCGLDLAPNKGIPHTLPNILETRDRAKDNRLQPAETRNAPRTFSNPSLKVYENWFSNTNLNGRIFRLSDGYNFSNKLHNTPDVNWNFALSETKETKTIKPQIISSSAKIPKEQRRDFIKKIVEKNGLSESWIKELLPLDYILYQRSENSKKESEYIKLRQKLSKTVVIK